MLLRDVATQIRVNQSKFESDNVWQAVDLILSKYNCINPCFDTDHRTLLIVKIARDMGFDLYESKINKGIISEIMINEELKQICDSDKVIVVDKSASYCQKRFAIACEIGHYLFSFPNTVNVHEYFKVSSYNEIFENTLNVKDNTTILVNRFASELLVPEKLFKKTYKKIKKRKIITNYELVSKMSEIFSVPINTILTIIKRYEMTK